MENMEEKRILLYNPSSDAVKIGFIKFAACSSNNIEKLSVIEINAKDLYAIDSAGQRSPMKHSVIDGRLGVNQKFGTCDTCKNSLNDCLGHFGYINLKFPVFNVGFFRNVIDILQTVCKNPSCARVLLLEHDMKTFHRKLRSKNLSYIAKKSICKQIREKAKKCSICPHCSVTNGVVKKFGFLKIAHEKYRTKKRLNELEEKMKLLESAQQFNPEILDGNSAMLAVDILNPIDVLHIFKSIPPCDVPLLAMSPEHCLPKDLIFSRVPVIPLSIRPSASSDLRAGTNEDDLTMKVSEIVFVNEVISNHKNSGAKVSMLLEDWDYLQLNCALYINSETPGLPSGMLHNKPSRGLVQRLKGKKGRFRGNLSGKRADFTARTVISPDPYLAIGEVGIPLHVARTLTYPEYVFSSNIDLMRQLIINGPDTHPGANYVYQTSIDNKRSLRVLFNREKIARDLREGDIVERHLLNGDFVLFNRQPSLHKLSIMCLRTKVIKDRTFKFNECNCTPYNADFDGDEMNVHFPQTELARAEAMILMDNTSNLLTPRNGDILIAATQDFITGTYILTLRDTFLDKTEISRLLTWLCVDNFEHIDLPLPTILKPKLLWTGKQVITALLKPNQDCKVQLNLRTKGRRYTAGEDMCYKDSFIVIRNSELLLGTLDKSCVGSGSKANIFYRLYCDWGKQKAALALLKISRISTYFLMNYGFSFGIGDVTAGEELLKIKSTCLADGFKKCEQFIASKNEGKLQCHPGLTERQTLEALILKELSIIREHVGKFCLTELHMSNSALIMALCGSKGSVINLSQMIACVGQQAINGKRVGSGFGDRSLPYFDRNCQHPLSRGFCHNSFYTGLTPTEFFFHTMAGREGLIDTAVKTAETGYMQRRLVKALEDISVQYDMTVRNCQKDVIQFHYGDDGLDPTFMEGDNCPVNFSHSLENAGARFFDHHEPPMDPKEISKLTEEMLSSGKFSECSELFISDLREFCDNIVNKLVDVLDSSYCKVLGMQSSKITRTIHEQFLEECATKYKNAVVEPGVAVGCLAAQSIGEPGTQMTLKTFHFAGVASMNITQGVPRIKEIINCTKNISTPIVTIYLNDDASEEAARKVKARLERTYLCDIADYFEEAYGEKESYLFIKLNLERIKLLQLNVNAHSIAEKIYNLPGAATKIEHVSVSHDKFIIISVYRSCENVNRVLRDYKQTLKQLVIQGLPSVKRAFVHEEVSKGVKFYKILAESEDLLNIMAVHGVNGKRCWSNSIHGTYRALGVEATRSIIMSEIKSVMENHGMSVDPRHIMLLADLMTCKGEPFGITRHGMVKMKESVLNLASFEKTSDHLFDAAYYGQIDRVSGISENIIVGEPIPLGTGCFQLIYKNQPYAKPEERTTIFDNPKYHKNTLPG